jgi:hypothetical protein
MIASICGSEWRYAMSAGRLLVRLPRPMGPMCPVRTDDLISPDPCAVGMHRTSETSDGRQLLDGQRPIPARFQNAVAPNEAAAQYR